MLLLTPKFTYNLRCDVIWNVAEGWRDGSVGQRACHQDCEPNLIWGTHMGEGRNLPKFSLTSICKSWHTYMCAFTHTVHIIEIFLNRSLCTMTKAVALQRVGSESKGVSYRKPKKTQSKAKPPMVETELGVRHLHAEGSQTLLATDRSLGEREGIHLQSQRKLAL